MRIIWLTLKYTSEYLPWLVLVTENRSHKNNINGFVTWSIFIMSNNVNANTVLLDTSYNCLQC